MERRVFPDIELFDMTQLAWSDPWRFVSEADRKRINAWAGAAFDPQRRATDSGDFGTPSEDPAAV